MTNYAEQLGIDGQEAAAAAVPRWFDLAYAALCRLAADGWDFTSEDVVDDVGLPNPDATEANQNNAVGSVFGHASRAGRIVAVGSRKGTTKQNHGARLIVWRGAEWVHQ